MPASPPPRTKASQAPADSACTEDYRSTIIPGFDVEAFARDSEVRQRAALPDDEEVTLENARRLHREGNHEQALSLLAGFLERTPLHAAATGLSNACRAALESECVLALGSEATVLICAFSREELKRFSLDHVSGFLLSLLDGETPVDAILDASGMAPLVVLRRLRDLLERGIIVACRPKRR